MMHEALPPNSAELPFDAAAFDTPLQRLPPRLRAPLAWAWAAHFRPLALDLAYLMECVPQEHGKGDGAGELSWRCPPLLGGRLGRGRGGVDRRGRGLFFAREPRDILMLRS